MEIIKEYQNPQDHEIQEISNESQDYEGPNIPFLLINGKEIPQNMTDIFWIDDQDEFPDLTYIAWGTMPEQEFNQTLK